MRLAQTLAELGEGDARTVAYVPRRAEGPAALVALACDQLVLQEGATLGGAIETAHMVPGNDFQWLNPDKEEEQAEEPVGKEKAPADRPGRRLKDVLDGKKQKTNSKTTKLQRPWHRF